MTRMTCLFAAVAALTFAAPAAHADSISDVEGARAHERQGSHLTRQEREKLRRYGGNDDGYYSGYGYGGGYGGAPSVGIYVGPGPGYGDGYGGGYGYAGPRGYDGPYGY